MKYLLKNLTKCQIHHNKQIKLTSYCVIIYVTISKHCICIYHNKACSITASNGACNNIIIIIPLLIHMMSCCRSGQFNNRPLFYSPTNSTIYNCIDFVYLVFIGHYYMFRLSTSAVGHWFSKSAKRGEASPYKQ
jgi:hypothetical protein